MINNSLSKFLKFSLLLLAYVFISCNETQLSEREKHCELFKDEYHGVATSTTNFREFETTALYVENEEKYKLYLTTFDDECNSVSTLFVGPFTPTLGDTIFLSYGGDNPGNSAISTAYYVERDYDYQLAYYWIPDSTTLDNWIYLKEINPSKKEIVGTFEISLIRKRGWVDNKKDSIYFNNGVLEAIQDPDQE